MSKCIFCRQELNLGEIFHESDQCKNERQKTFDSIYKNDRITIGTATCGLSAGAGKVLENFSASGFSIPVEEVGCSGMCYNEPIVTVKQNGLLSIYGNVTESHVEKLSTAIKEGRRYEPCFVSEKQDDIDYFKKQTRVLMERCGVISPLDLKHYLSTGGFEGLRKALKMKPAEVIDEVKAAGLRGRGGAGFLTGLKWGLFAPAKGTKYLIINGDAGDPGAFMNRTIIESDPYQMLEGFIIASYATGAQEGIIYIRAEYPLACDTLRKAISTLEKANLLGTDILGVKGFTFKIRIMKGAGAFVCGEETALIKSVQGMRGQPMPRPPFPAQRGVFGNPTNINNVETYSHVPHIMIMGSQEYKKNGSPNNAGTKCVCLTGKVKYSGVVEVQLGIPIRTLVFDIGGGIKGNRRFKAVQTGGPSGGCIVESELDTPMDYDSIPKLGTIMGSGGLVVMDEDDCMVAVAKFFLTFTTSESCGKCVPCREGTKRMLEMVEKISRGVATEDDIERLKNLAVVIKDTSLCGLGQSAPNPVLSTVRKFKDEYLMHIKDKHCATGVCEALIKYIINGRCVGCGNCERHCPVKAITGKLKEKYLIHQEQCIKCGKCYKVCAFKAIDRK